LRSRGYERSALAEIAAVHVLSSSGPTMQLPTCWPTAGHHADGGCTLPVYGPWL